MAKAIVIYRLEPYYEFQNYKSENNYALTVDYFAVTQTFIRNGINIPIRTIPIVNLTIDDDSKKSLFLSIYLSDPDPTDEILKSFRSILSNYIIDFETLIKKKIPNFTIREVIV